MNTSHLKYFYDVYRLESVVEAAKTNHVAPSTISQALRSLENELGFELTSKQRGQLILSKKAEALALKIPKLLDQVEEIRSFRMTKTSELEGQLRIATHQSLLASHLWQPIRTFKKNHPKVELSLITGLGPYLSNLLIQNQVDLTISLERPPGGTQMKSQLLHNGSFVLVGRNGLVFSKKSQILVTSKSKPEVQHLIKTNHGIEVEELTNWSTIKSVLMNEDVFGFVPDYLIHHELKKGILSKVNKVTRKKYEFQISSWFQKDNATNPILIKFNELASLSFKEK